MNKEILGLVFAATFSMLISFNHPAYAGVIQQCHDNSQHVNPNDDRSACVCDPGFTPQPDGSPFTPICIPTSVGGMGIPIDTTALLLAEIQGSALWMIPAIVVAGAGIGIVSFKRSKKKQD